MRLVVLVVGLVLVGCTSSDEPAGPTSSTSSSTTTIVDDTCERIIDDGVDFVGRLLEELDRTRLVDFRDRRAWSDDLTRLERLGADLDIRAVALDCDAGSVRLGVLERADLRTGGPLSEGLVALLLDPPEGEAG